ncbi:MAG: hypothetical protein K2J80_05860 [Oscillospiraceae bacterium]|nr:hypothetical protein [Oscillospiraceae bacterium]
MRLFYILVIALSGAYLIAQTIAWVFYGKTFYPDSGELFENKADKTLWQTVFPKNMLRLVIVIFAGAVFGLLLDIVIPEGWLTIPLGAVGGITVNFIISRFFSPMYLKLHKSGEPTEGELEGMSARVTETITKDNFGVISVRHGHKSYLFRAVSANGRRLPKGTAVVVLHAQDSCCFVESEEHLCDVLFEDDGEEES